MSREPPEWKPAGTAIPAEAREDDSDESDEDNRFVPQPLWARWFGGRMAQKGAFNPLEASWDASQWIIKTVFFGFVAVVATHWFRGWLTCQHSVRADMLQERVEQLEDEKRAVEEERDEARGVFRAPDNSKLPGGQP